MADTTKCIVLFSLIAGACCLRLEAADLEIYDSHVGGRYFRAYVVVEPEPMDFSCKQASEMADKFCKRHPDKDFYLIRLFAANSGCFSAFPSSDTPFNGIRRMRKDSEAKTRTCAEVLVTKTGSLTRIRPSNSKVEQCVSGENPLLLRVGTKVIWLLWLQYWDNGIVDDESLDAFALSDVVSVEEAAEAMSVLRRRFPSPDLRLDIKTLPWFPYNTLFPVYFPYLQGFEPPSDEQNSGLPRIYCTETRGGGSNCVAYGAWKKP